MTSRYLTQTAPRNEEALLSAAQDGDRHAQEELLRRYEPLVRHTVRRLQLPCQCDRDEIAQEARLGLLRAIRAWQPARGPFPAFAARCVHNKTANALSHARTRKHQLLSTAMSLDCTPLDTHRPAPLLDEYWNPPTFAGLIPAPDADPASAVLVREQLDAVRAAWSTLSDKERAAIAGVLNGKSQRQIASEMACTVKAVGCALRRARAKLAIRGVDPDTGPASSGLMGR